MVSSSNPLVAHMITIGSLHGHSQAGPDTHVKLKIIIIIIK